MAVYFVTRHEGAEEWARRHRPDARLKRHLCLEEVSSGDRILGTLPVHLVADINARGVRYFDLVVKQTAAERGQEHSADELERRGARLVEFRVERVG